MAEVADQPRLLAARHSMTWRLRYRTCPSRREASAEDSCTTRARMCARRSCLHDPAMAAQGEAKPNRAPVPLAFSAREFQSALDDGARDGQTDAHPVPLGGEKRSKTRSAFRLANRGPKSRTDTGTVSPATLRDSISTRHGSLLVFPIASNALITRFSRTCWSLHRVAEHWQRRFELRGHRAPGARRIGAGHAQNFS